MNAGGGGRPVHWRAAHRGTGAGASDPDGTEGDMKIAFLGTGLMGHPMAARLLAQGHTVNVYNRTAEKAADLASRGAHLAPTPAGAMAEADWVVAMLTDAPVVQAALLDGGARDCLAGRRVLNASTIAPHEARELARAVADAGGEYMECPVLGSIPQARDGTLIVMFGGSPAQFQAAGPVLGAFGSEPVHVGPVGQAAALKLAMNQLIAALTEAFSFSLGLVRREGVPVDLFMGVLRNSALYAPTYDKKLDRMLRRDFDRPNFPVKHMAKDVDLLLEAGRRAGLDIGCLEAAARVLGQAREAGLEDCDYSALYNVVDPRD